MPLPLHGISLDIALILTYTEMKTGENKPTV